MDKEQSIRDKTEQDLISNRKLETQQGDVIVLFLDGEYWGVYILIENYDDHYIANNYDINDDNVVIIKNSIGQQFCVSFI